MMVEDRWSERRLVEQLDDAEREARDHFLLRFCPAFAIGSSQEQDSHQRSAGLIRYCTGKEGKCHQAKIVVCSS
jgi:hypothetical protein